MREAAILAKRMFVHTKVFDSNWEDLGCGDDELSELQKDICENPQRPPVIRGTGGVRKIRFGASGRGKRGGARVLYGDFPEHEVVYLFDAYPKGAKEDITEDERKLLMAMMRQVNENWRAKK